MIATTQQNMTTELVCRSFIVFFVCLLFFSALPYNQMCLCVQPSSGLRGESFHGLWGIPIHRLLLCPFAHSDLSVNILDRLDSCTAVQTSVVPLSLLHSNADLKSTSYREDNWSQQVTPHPPHLHSNNRAQINLHCVIDYPCCVSVL